MIFDSTFYIVLHNKENLQFDYKNSVIYVMYVISLQKNTVKLLSNVVFVTCVQASLVTGCNSLL